MKYNQFSIITNTKNNTIKARRCLKTAYKKGGKMKRKVYKQIEVAKMIGVHRNSVYRWVRDGKIKSVLVAGVRMIPASEIEKLTGEE